MHIIKHSEIKKEKLWSKNYILLMISNSFLFFGDILLIPVLPIYLKQNDANNFQIGIIISIFFASSILTRMFTAKASARLGQRTLLLLAVFFFASAMFGYYLFSSLIAIFAIRIIQGMSFGTATTLYSAITASSIPNERMGEGIGYFGVMATIASALGPLLGATAIASPDYQWVFLAAMSFSMIGLISSFFISIDNSRDSIEKISENKFISEIIEPKVFFEGGLLLLVGLILGSYDTYTVLFAREISISNITTYFIAAAFAELLSRTFGGQLYDKKGLYIMVIPGAIFGFTSCIVMSNATSLMMITLSGFLMGLGLGMTFPVLEANALKKIDSDHMIAANATIYNSLDIGTTLGPLLFGALLQYASYSQTFTLSSLIFITMIIVLLIHIVVKKTRGTNQCKN